jgi:hypothetical protein
LKHFEDTARQISDEKTHPVAAPVLAAVNDANDANDFHLATGQLIKTSSD